MRVIKLRKSVGVDATNFYMDVGMVQIILNEILNENLTVDGVFGIKTQELLLEFQKNNGIYNEKIVSNQSSTFKKMVESLPLGVFIPTHYSHGPLRVDIGQLTFDSEEMIFI